MTITAVIIAIIAYLILYAGQPEKSKVDSVEEFNSIELLNVIVHQYLEDPGAEYFLIESLKEYLEDTFSPAKQLQLLEDIKKISILQNTEVELYEICEQYPELVFYKLNEDDRKKVASLAMDDYHTRNRTDTFMRNWLLLQNHPWKG